MSGFNGTDPNGTWRLYVVDDLGNDDGVIFGGWRLLFGLAPGTPAPPVAPTLDIALAGDQATLSWPSTAPGWQLEARGELSSAPGWTTVTNAIGVAGGEFTVTVDAGAGARFFRLRKTTP